MLGLDYLVIISAPVHPRMLKLYKNIHALKKCESKSDEDSGDDEDLS